MREVYGLDFERVAGPLERASRAVGRFDEALRSTARLDELCPYFSILESCQMSGLAGALVQPEDVLRFAAGAGRYDEHGQLAEAAARAARLLSWCIGKVAPRQGAGGTAGSRDGADDMAGLELTAARIEALADDEVPGWRSKARPVPDAAPPPTPSPAPPRDRSVLDEMDAMLAGDTLVEPDQVPAPAPPPDLPADLEAWCRERAARVSTVLGVVDALDALERMGVLGLAARRLQPVLGAGLLHRAMLLHMPLPFVARGLRAARRKLGPRPAAQGVQNPLAPDRSDALAWDLAALAIAAEGAHFRLLRMREFREKWLGRAGECRAQSRLKDLVGLFVQAPVRPAPQVAKALDLTLFGASRLLQRLVDWGMLVEVSGRRKCRVFAAPELLRLG